MKTSKSKIIKILLIITLVIVSIFIMKSLLKGELFNKNKEVDATTEETKNNKEIEEDVTNYETNEYKEFDFEGIMSKNFEDLTSEEIEFIKEEIKIDEDYKKGFEKDGKLFMKFMMNI